MPERHDVVAGHGEPVEGAEHVEQRLEGLGLVQDGKGDEEAHAGGVDGRGRDLQVARELDLPLGLERVHVAADLQDVGGDRVAGGVVGAHGWSWRR